MTAVAGDKLGAIEDVALDRETGVSDEARKERIDVDGDRA